MILAEQLAPRSAEKAKRSLIIVACSTLVFSTFLITSNEISFLGLTLEISQAKIVKVGRICCGILMVHYLLKSLPIYLLQYKDLMIERRERANQHKLENFREDILGPRNAHYEHTVDQIIESEEAALSSELHHLNRKLEIVISGSQAFAVTITDMVFPILIGSIAIFYPNLLDDFIST